jgi:pyroglutamyl-peptidase
MTATVLITGFGPFPGAPVNPTGPLVTELAGRRIPALRHIRRFAHVFPVTYAAVDRELPALLARIRPDALVMFGLAPRRRHIRIETRARNAISGVVPDASGHLPAARMIAPGARATLSLRAPAQKLVAAVRAAGLPAALSSDAGSYLCNYLCWRAREAVEREGISCLVAFVHVPSVHVPSVQIPNVQMSKVLASVRVPSARALPQSRSQRPMTFDDLVRAGEAIVRAAAVPARR